MMNFRHQRGKGFWIKRAILIPIAIAAGVFVFGSAVMLLWNNLLPAVFGIGTITFWQAIGILVLSKILFGGFSGGHRHGRSICRCQCNCNCNGNCDCRSDHHNEKWMNLTPEEKEKMKSEWKDRCCHSGKEE
ncbi:MAG: hypothetical protein WCI31_11555 [Prolixibacteraceae bacterium]